MTDVPRHLGDDRLMDAVEGLATRVEREHASTCAACAQRIDEAKEGLALARPAEMPEPSPLYWEAFRRQVNRRLDDHPGRGWWWRLGPALAAAALLVLMPPLRTPDPPVETTAPWSALPDEDAGLTVLVGVASSGVDLGPVRGDVGLTEDLAELSDEDSQALARALRTELGKSRS